MSGGAIAGLFMILSPFWIVGAVIWGAYWAADRKSTRRARMILSTPVWFIPGLAMLYVQITKLIIDARPGRKEVNDD